MGKAFGAALLAYEDSAVIGVKPANGLPLLNPPMDRTIDPGDQIIAISEDDDTVRLSGLEWPQVDDEAIERTDPVAPVPERTLILGWNWRVPSLIRELDNYVASGSLVHVLSDYDRCDADIARMSRVVNQTVTCQNRDTTDRRTLDELDVSRFQHVILLCYSDRLERQQADARTLITLLHLRDIAKRRGNTFSITSEMLDVRNRALAAVTQADDFIVSDRLISLMLSQVSENKWLNAVFADLFDPEGSEVYLKPAADYVKLGTPVTFYTAVESARRRGHVAFAYRLKAHASDASRQYGVVVNPKKSERITFTDGDKIAVLADG